MIVLQPFHIDDAPALISNIKDRRSLLQFAGPMYHFPLTQDQLERDLSDENRTLFKIVDIGNQKTIGHAQIFLKRKHFCWAGF